jgi:DNA polymerase I
VTESRGTLFLIDGSNIVYRSYFAIRGLSNSSGLATNAVYGFTQTLRKMLKDYTPDAVAVAFDVPGEKVRHQQFEDYKKDRRPMPDDLSVQIPLVYEVLEAFGLPILTIPEFEADDVLGTLACRARDAGYKVVIATADKDFFQLVGDGISLYHAGREVMYDAAGAKEAFGVEPEKVADVMALWGDAIDNIPGVPGIGEKTAKALIIEFGSLDQLYANLDKVKKPAQREKLQTNRDAAFLSRELATIRCDLDVKVEFDALKLRPPDRSRLHDLFARLEFHSLLQEYLPEPEAVPIDYRVVRDPNELRKLLAESNRPIAVHFEPEFADDFGPPAVAAISQRDHQALIVPLAPHLGGSKELTDLVKSLTTNSHRLIAHDMKAELRRLTAAGWPVPQTYDDTMIMSYVLHPGAYGHELDTLSRERLRRDVMSFKALLKCAPALNLEKPCLDYVGEKTDITMSLLSIVEPELERSPELKRIYQTLELPLIPVLARMEDRGIKIDIGFLNRMSNRMATQLADLESRIYAESGQEFNINSPSQLAMILFEKLQYPVLKKTQKTKSSSTGVEVLTELAGYGYAVPQLILEHRELHKLKSTYVDALPQLVGHDGRVHTSFNQAVAATGRLSSSNPNLQNIPIRTEQGREIRRAFIAEEGNVLLSADYSQIELRVLAHVTGDPALIEAFSRGADIHRATAAKMFNVPEDQVTANQRRAAKVINFGVLYGMSAFRVSNELGITTGEAKDFVDNYFARYPRIQEYLDRTLEEARTTGKVTTMFGRVRHIPEIHNRSFTVRSNAERMATNAPIQGAAADLLKMAMVALDARLEKEAPEAGMLLTVHDEIVIEAPEKRAPEVAVLVKTTMQSIQSMAVPLDVETHWGKSWFEAKD